MSGRLSIIVWCHTSTTLKLIDTYFLVCVFKCLLDFGSDVGFLPIFSFTNIKWQVCFSKGVYEETNKFTTLLHLKVVNALILYPG